MRRHRVYSDQPLSAGQTIELETGPARHLIRVLRLANGSDVIVFNGDGNEYSGTLQQVGGKGRCQVELTAAHQPATESSMTITLIQAIARGEKMDWCIRKSVELGISRIQPLISERTEVRLSAEREVKRLAHWQQVAIAACEQCGRARLPHIAAPVDLEDLIDDSRLRLVLDPEADATLASLNQPSATDRISVLVGPEGGLSRAEIDHLTARGFVGIRFGPRTLRTETAGIAVLAAVQAQWGDCA